ncbi:MAG: hypothetical protein N2259_01770 [Patescibacteria group bacterium]|nr:hypothetical protein [Patescibacteria group bacterium]
MKKKIKEKIFYISFVIFFIGIIFFIWWIYGYLVGIGETAIEKISPPVAILILLIALCCGLIAEELEDRLEDRLDHPDKTDEKK